MEKMSSIIRREFKKGDDIRDAGLTAPDGDRQRTWWRLGIW